VTALVAARFYRPVIYYKLVVVRLSRLNLSRVRRLQIRLQR
jgi:hypothetical protein